MATHSRILAWRSSMDRGAWWATAHGVAKSWTRLNQLTMHLDGRESIGGKIGFFQAHQDTMGSKVLPFSKRREVGRFELGASFVSDSLQPCGL